MGILLLLKQHVAMHMYFQSFEEGLNLIRPQFIVESAKDLTNDSESPQSSNVSREAVMTNVPNDVYQTLMFTENSYADCVCYDAEVDPTYGLGGSENSTDSITSFLSRPTLIRTFTTTSNDLEIDPWAEFLDNTAIISKIRNYSFIRGKLHLRFVWNASPFIYGRTLVSYTPGRTVNGSMSLYSPSLADIALRQMNSVHLSQREVTAFIDPTTSIPLTLKLPFVYPTNYIDITNIRTSILSLQSPVGTLVLSNIVPTVKTDGGTPEPVTITVYAYMEDVELTIPTIENPVTESGKPELDEQNMNESKNSDEYGGIVSKPANVIASMANSLESVPIIGPFAMSTKLAAGAVADIARVFGFSKPAEVTPTHKYYTQFTDAQAHGIGDVNTNSLTFDPKSELTVDPRTMGLGSADELNIRHVCCRYSILSYDTWSATDIAGTTLIARNVTPVSQYLNIGTPRFEIAMTPSKFMSRFFQYWRGSFIYKFDFVASAFHKGKVLITFEPGLGTPLTTQSNEVYSAIVDLSVTRSYEFVVGWACEYNWLRTGDLLLTAGFADECNGRIQLKVLTPLTSPQPSDITVITSVKAGSDIEFNSPYMQIDDGTADTPRFITESGNFFSYDHPDMNTDQSPVFDLVPTKKSLPELRSIHFGDPVLSLRLYVKRFCNYMFPFSSFDNSTLTGDYIVGIKLPLYPVTKVDASNGGVIAVNDVVTTPIPYIMSMYAVVRGGVRYKAILGKTHYGNNTQESSFAAFTRIRSTTDETLFTPFRAVASNNMRDQLMFATTPNTKIASSTLGMYGQPTQHVRALDATIPFFNNKRFAFTLDFLSKSMTNNTGFDDLVLNGFIFYTTANRTSGTQPPNVLLQAAASEDFTCGYFRGVPVMLYG